MQLRFHAKNQKVLCVDFWYRFFIKLEKLVKNIHPKYSIVSLYATLISCRKSGKFHMPLFHETWKTTFWAQKLQTRFFAQKSGFITFSGRWLRNLKQNIRKFIWAVLEKNSSKTNKETNKKMIFYRTFTSWVQRVLNGVNIALSSSDSKSPTWKFFGMPKLQQLLSTTINLPSCHIFIYLLIV